MEKEIKIKIEKSEIKETSVFGGIQGEGGARTLKISFDSEWSGLTKKITFFDGAMQNPVIIALTEDKKENGEYSVKIPSEPLKTGGKFTFIIDGTADGIRQRSVQRELRVKYAYPSKGTEETETITPTVAEQLTASVNSNIEKTTELSAEVENNKTEIGTLKGRATAAEAAIALKADKTELPKKVSELENDSGYLTEHQSLEAYAKKTEVSLKADKTELSEIKTELESKKVDKTAGKGLSSNDYTDEEKSKLAALPEKDVLDNALDGYALKADAVGKKTEDGGEIFNNYDGLFINQASGDHSHAEGAGVSAGGTFSHAEGKGSNASGKSAHAEGSLTAAFGDYSHSEGDNSTAEGEASHAEGGYSRAKGLCAHAEGFETEATADFSHSEGYYTKANQNCAHAEGNNTVASGHGAHSEGEYTEATGHRSHSEGYYTKANGIYSHVQGKYNIADNADKYAHIVGNGTDENSRSNAHTIDWNGNGWFKGELKIGGTSYDDGERLIKESDLLKIKQQAIPQATVQSSNVKISDGLSGEEPLSLKLWGNSGKNMLKATDFYSALQKLAKGGDNILYEELEEDGRKCVRFIDNFTARYQILPFKENTQYTISMDCRTKNKTNENTIGSTLFVFFYTDGTFSDAVPLERNTPWTHKTATSKANKTISAVGIRSRTFSNWCYVDVDTFQLEEGAAATDYEAFDGVGDLNSASGKYEISVSAADYEKSISGGTLTATLDRQLSPGEYIDLIGKKLVSAVGETDITVSGELEIPETETCYISAGTEMSPEKIEAGYYQDINKVIKEMKNSILSLGGNV